MNSQNKKPHILFLFSDTGGGHRSATEAIIEALKLEYVDSFSFEMVDIFKDHAPRPLNRMPDWYPYMVRVPQLWGASFYATNGRPQARAITATIWPVAARTARAIIQNHPCDLVVSVHGLANASILKALGPNRPPFITVVTDLVTGHALWYDRRADLILVPTEAAREHAIHYHMSPDKIRVVGLPVAARCCMPVGDKNILREKLGWPKNKMIVLVVGGGDGVGPLKKTVNAIAASGLDVALVVVTGRNTKLKHDLESQPWPIPLFVYGFTKEMPDFMRAANILVSKAGPQTIGEALNANLPIIMYSRLIGQEDGNVDYVRDAGAGVWAPTSRQVVATLRNWIMDPEEMERVVQACQRAARPEAAQTVALIIGERLGLVAIK
jgi:1,2-diacylglycerol 3-beta-galactosyltransferase